MDPKPGDIWYRYEDHMYSTVIDADREEYGSSLEVHQKKYTVVRVTPKGVWLCSGANTKVRDGKLFKTYLAPRFVLRECRKRFACPTIDEAKESFYARKDKQARIYEGRAATARRCIEIVKTGNRWSLFER